MSQILFIAPFLLNNERFKKCVNIITRVVTHDFQRIQSNFERFLNFCAPLLFSSIPHFKQRAFFTKTFVLLVRIKMPG